MAAFDIETSAATTLFEEVLKEVLRIPSCRRDPSEMLFNQHVDATYTGVATIRMPIVSHRPSSLTSSLESSWGDCSPRSK